MRARFTRNTRTIFILLSLVQPVHLTYCITTSQHRHKQSYHAHKKTNKKLIHHDYRIDSIELLKMNHDYETRQILRKEPIYRKLYSSLLQEHRGILQAPPTDENSTTTTTITTQHHDDTNHPQQHNQFEDEDQILNTIFQTEMKNILVGVGASLAALASLRFVRSSYASSTVFGSVKAKAMQEAEREGKKRGTDTFQKNFCT